MNLFMVGKSELSDIPNHQTKSKSSNSRLPFLSGLHLFRLLSYFLTNSFQF